MNRVKLTVILLLFLIPFLSNGQNPDLQAAINKYNKEASIQKPWLQNLPHIKPAESLPFQSGISKISQEEIIKIKKRLGKKSFSENDSLLIIGIPPLDSLIITGNWKCNVDILVFGEGKLRFKNANATLLGNLYVWGEKAEITADSSYLYIPQLYFYQRSITALGAGKVKFNQVTLDFSGLSHSILATDSSQIDFNHVTKKGFTTNGVSSNAIYKINDTNIAGEFVIEDKCTLNFENANTVLLWHVVPENGIFHFNFPPSGNVNTYHFSPYSPGIGNIDYSIDLKNCSDVMWAVMPSSQSDVNIQNSQLRAIGLWFTTPDSVVVKGLVNNSDYTFYTAPLPDRSLVLQNSSVQTWSLYPMNTSKIAVSSCILGEIGAQGSAEVFTSSIFVDGSGGFMWGTDTTFTMAFSTALTTHIRSQGNGIVIYAYSPLTAGAAIATNNSTLIVLQSSIPDEPVAYDGASLWNLNIKSPSAGNTNSIVPIIGHALIDCALLSTHPEMSWYQMYYSLPESDSLIAITSKIYIEKRNDTLALWNTSGLKAGQYLLHLFVADSSENPIIIEAVKTISLNQGTYGIKSNIISTISIYPNPVVDIATIDVPWEDTLCTIIDAHGKQVFSKEYKEPRFQINLSDLDAGIYFLIASHGAQTTSSRLIIL